MKARRETTCIPNTYTDGYYDFTIPTERSRKPILLHLFAVWKRHHNNFKLEVLANSNVLVQNMRCTEIIKIPYYANLKQ